MIESFGKGNVSDIEGYQKKSTAVASVSLFAGLKSNDPYKPLVISFEI